MKKKYTDDIFRDKLKDFHETPDPAVWDRIENSLNKRKRQGVIPIWWTLGGVAALVVLGIFLYSPGGEDALPSGVGDSPTVVKEADTKDSSVETTEQKSISREQNQEESISQEQNQKETIPGEFNQEETILRELNQEEGLAQSKTEAASKNEKSAAPEVDSFDPAATRPDPKNAVASQTASEQTVKTIQERQTDQKGQAIQERQTGLKAEQERTVIQQKTPAISETAVTQNSVDSKEQENSSQIGQESTQTEASKLMELPEAKTADTAVAKTEEEDSEKGKISILDAAAEQEALSRNDDELQNLSEQSKAWTVGPAVAPVFYSNFGNGSPLDQDFVPNSKSGTLNMSFGVAIAYAVTGKLSVRSGVHRVDFGYNTNQVSFSPTLDARPTSLIRTISYSENSRNVVVHSNVDGTGAQAIENSLDVSAQTPLRNGSMLQEFGYLEIPLEMQYALVEGKFGVNVIGGMSSLFLVNNSVSLDSSGSRTEIGEANNINSVNFSSNLGLGLYYNLNSSMQLNLQPMFKYHMNAFSQTAGDFQPYTLGVYSGLSFRF